MTCRLISTVTTAFSSLVGRRGRTVWLVAALMLILLGGETPRTQGAPVSVPAFQESGLRPATPAFSQFPFETIDLINGNVLTRLTDLHLPGNAGFDLTFVRTHNSRDGVWRFGIEQAPMELMVGSWAEECGAFTNVRDAFHWIDGSVEPSNCYAASGGVDDLTTSRYGSYTRSQAKLRLPNGLVATYGWTSGFTKRITRLEDPFSNFVEFAWDQIISETSVQLNVTVTQHLGADSRQITLTGLNAASHGGDTVLAYAGRQWRSTFGPVVSGYNNLSVTHATLADGSDWDFTYTVFGTALAGSFIFPISRVETPQSGTIDYVYEQRQAGNFDCSCTYLALKDRTVTTGGQSAQWSFASFQLLAAPYTVLNNPDGTQLTYLFENRQAGGFYRTVLPISRTLTRPQTGATFESETFDHILIQNGTHYTPALSSRTVHRDGQTYTTTLSYNGQAGYTFFKPTSITETGQLTRTTTLEYAGFSGPYILGRISQRTVTVSGQNMVESFAFNSQNGFMTQHSVLGVTTTYGEGADGNVATVTDPRGKTTGLSYEWGVAKNTTTPEYTITRAINADGTVDEATRGATTTSYEYDALGRVTQAATNTPGRQATITTYDSAGGWVNVAQGANGLKTYVDGFGRPIETVDAAGARTRTEYDQMGRVKYKSYPFDNGHPEAGESMSYDGLGRLTHVAKPAGWIDYAYGAGTVTTTANAPGGPARTTTQTYEAFGNPDSGRLKELLDSAGGTWTYSYDPMGHLVGVQAPVGPDRTWDYAGGPFLASTTQPESGTTTFVNDAAGNVTTSTDALGRVTTFTYDNNGRLIFRGSDGTEDDLTIAYDAWDNQTSVANGVLTTTYEYDTANRLHVRRDHVAGQILAQVYTYDGSDNPVSLEYPSGRAVRYEYGSQHRLTGAFTRRVTGEPERVLASANSVAYHPSGALKQFDYGNGQQYRNLNPDSYGRPQQWASGPLGITYSYDHLGNVTNIADVRGGGFTHSYGYDALDRLTHVGTDHRFEYDPVGNRTRAGSVLFTYSGSTQQLASLAGGDSGSFAFNPVGNMATDHLGGTYTYSPLDMLKTATVGGQTSTYTYDGDGMRVSRTTSSGTRYYLHGGSNLLAEYTADGANLTLAKEYLYLGGTLVSSFDAAPSVTVSVALTSPATGTQFDVGAPVTLTAVPGSVGAVDRVEFYVNGLLLATDTTAPYSVTRTDLPFGPGQQVQARLVTTTGVPAVSAVSTITVGSYVAGDFNLDGYPDLLFQDPTGALKAWFMQGATKVGEADLLSSAHWKVVGLGDVNGDWRTDLVLQSSATGAVHVWYLNGTTLIGDAPLFTGVTDFTVSVLDLNGDEHPDLVWTVPSTGQRYAWLLSNVTLIGEGFLSIPVVSIDWQIVSIADLNADGREDLVWRYIDGTQGYWFMDGLTVLSGGLFVPPVVDPAWALRASANFDRANGIDLVYQHTTTHQLYLFFMSGTTIIGDSSLNPSSIASGWTIVGGR